MKQDRIEESQTGRDREVSQVEMVQSVKASQAVDVEQNASRGDYTSKILQGGTKVDTDITNKLSHGKPNKPSSPRQTIPIPSPSLFA